MSYETLGTPLKRVLTKADKIKTDPCYFGKISRFAAENCLKDRATQEGTYLIREGDDGYRLSVIEMSSGECEVIHFKIEYLSNKTYCIDDSVSFATVMDLIQYYKGKHTNMEQRLTEPCPKKILHFEESYTNTAHLKEISRESISLKSQLLAGKFSDIWKGNVKTYENEVVIKIQNGDEYARSQMVREAFILDKVRHENVVRFLGVSSKDLIHLVTEFYTNRDLLDYLLRNDIYQISDPERLRCATEITQGLQHISCMGYVHRNIRACNVLLSSNNACKISGFGYAAKLDDHGKYIGNKDDKPIGPNMIRWMALESLESKEFSTSSDVWSLGCLFHELFSDGEAPFSGTLTPNILPKVKAGFRTPKPLNLSDAMYSIMLNCWNPDPTHRPSIKAILNMLKKLKDPPEMEQESQENPLQQQKPPPSSPTTTKEPPVIAKVERKNTYIKMKSFFKRGRKAEG